MSTVLNIANLHKSFGATNVLNDINIAIDEGDFLVLVGPSGCGKSTLLNCIAGLEPITCGEIEIGGQGMVGVPPKDRDIAMVFQSYALYPTMSVEKNITFGMKVRGASNSEQSAELEKVSKLLQIEHLLDRKPSQLSGGQRQRVAMGRALVRDPRLFLFDEPLSNLDAKLRVEMRTEIKRLHQRMNASIVYVTHDQIEAMTLASQIAVLKDGYLQQLGTPKEIYDTPVNMFVADFMGSPSMNLIEADVTANGDGGVISIRRKNGDDLTMNTAALPNELAGAEKKPVIFGIRPEAITEAQASGSSNTSETFSCLVDVVEPAGSDTFVVTTLAGREVTCRLGADAEVKPDDQAELAFDLSKAVFFDPASEKRFI